MMKVYMDRAARHDSAKGVMCVAATVFKPVRYKQFVRPWNRMLRGWGASAFHATDFYPGGGAFYRKTPDLKPIPARIARYDRDSKLIPSLIGEHTEQIIGVSFLQREFERAAPPAWKAKYGDNMHVLAVQMCMIAIGYWAKKANYFDGFSHVLESGDESEAQVAEVVGNMKKDEVVGPHIQCRGYAFVDKGKARGLETADMVAWHWNKFYVDRLSAAKPRDIRKDFAKLLTISADRIHLYFPTEEKLRFFLSLDPSVTGAGGH